MKKKSILLLTTVGGFIPQFEKESLKILKTAGYDILYASDFTNPVYASGEELLKTMGVRRIQIPIHKSPAALVSHRRTFHELVKIVRKYHVCCVHCHTPVGGFLGRMLGKHFGASLKVIYTAHGFHFYQGAPAANWLFYPVERYLARYTDALVTINSEDFDRAVHWKLRSGGKVYRIPGAGIRTERLYLSEEEKSAAADAVKRKFDIPENTRVLVSVGELNKNKNHAVVLKALARIREERMVYLIAGEGGRRKKLEREIRRRRLEKQVKLLGYQEHIAPILSAADIFVFPSRREGLGMAALEAMAMGVPVIASDNRGIREYVIQGVNGYRCSWKEEKAFARYIRQLSGDAGKREEMGRAAKRTAQRFSAQKTALVMQQVYENVLEEG